MSIEPLLIQIRLFMCHLIDYYFSLNPLLSRCFEFVKNFVTLVSFDFFKGDIQV